ncbi:unnamed protein product [Cuscuta epithymum]|uniref:CCHC-type domain-containing protein n=1 Tax=Cuscuta epithymum TaxID=186058 RepID=A0AAV0CJX3_9ASTE|nr:unnamed protein product [Cuscuta epithymum]
MGYLQIVSISLILYAAFFLSKCDGNDDYYVNATLVHSDPEAVCLTGKPASYYFDNGFSSGMGNWLVYLQGGAWCNNIPYCAQYAHARNITLDPKPYNFRYILSNKKGENPDFYNWNKVVIRYCDGSSFTSDSPKTYEYNGTKLYFRGARIYRAVMQEVYHKLGMKMAKNALLVGGSAGGVAATIHCDGFRDFLPNATRVKCLSDAGYFFPSKRFEDQGEIFTPIFQGLIAMKHGSIKALPKACTSKFSPYLIEDYLYQKKLHLPLFENKPESMAEAEWNLLDRQALGVVRLSLAKNVAYNIVNEKTTFGLLKALSNMYEKPSAANKVFLIRQLVNTRMKEGASVRDHINEFNSIISRLGSVEIKFDDEVQALLLLSSLPDSWSGTVTAVSSSSGTTKLTFEGIRDLILGEDIRRRSSGDSSNSLLSTEDRGRKSTRGGNKKGRSKLRKRGQSKNRKDINCWNCKENGHFRNHCPKASADKGKKEVNVTEDYEDVLICSVENSIESWIMDSGASFHACHCRDLMKNFRPYNGRVRLADDKSLEITGIGDVDLSTTLGTTWRLKDVRYIPDLKKMLISVGQLDEEGHNVSFGNKQWKVKKGKLVIARGQKHGTLYMVEVSTDGANAAVEDTGVSTLWHQRLGHISENGMKMLSSKGKIPDLKNSKLSFCGPCVLGKQKRVTFVKTRQQPKTERLELIHSDVYGPTKVSSIGGSRYYVTFIDDSTRKERKSRDRRAS